MKIIKIFLLSCLFLATACEEEMELKTPDFNVKTEAETYTVGEEVKFLFEGNPDFISFYSGELYNDYAFRDGRVLEPGLLKMSFSTSVRYATQANQLFVMASTDFNPDYNEEYTVEEVHSATWIDITDKFALATGSAFKASGEVDISDLVVDGKPLYIAFRYITRDQELYGLGRQWRIQNFRISTETSIGVLDLADQAGAGFRIVDENPGGIAPTRSTVTASVLTMGTHLATEENINVYTENWGITKPIFAGTLDLGPDKPVAVKGTGDDRMESYSYIYDEPGTYKAYFRAINANLKDSRDVIREVTVTINP